MLEYIKAHPQTIVQPAVDTIDQWSIEYEQRSHSTTEDMWRGVFLWDMRYVCTHLGEVTPEVITHSEK